MFSQIKGIGVKYLEHLFIISSSSHVLNKTDFKRYLFKRGLKAKSMGVSKVRPVA